MRKQDLDREDDVPYRAAPVPEVFAAERKEKKILDQREKVQRMKLRRLGFEDEGEVLH